MPKQTNIGILRQWADENPTAWKEMSYKEIAALLGIPEYTVQQKLLRVIAKRDNRLVSEVRFERQQAGFTWGRPATPIEKINLIYELYDKGLPIEDIAVKTGVEDRTVKKYLDARHKRTHLE